METIDGIVTDPQDVDLGIGVPEAETVHSGQGLIIDLIVSGADIHGKDFPVELCFDFGPNARFVEFFAAPSDLFFTILCLRHVHCPFVIAQ
jgi:hypothetical protein